MRDIEKWSLGIHRAEIAASLYIHKQTGQGDLSIDLNDGRLWIWPSSRGPQLAILAQVDLICEKKTQGKRNLQRKAADLSVELTLCHWNQCRRLASTWTATHISMRHRY